MFDSGFVHLDVRSAFSLKEGAFVPEHLAALAAEMEMPAVALTDRDGLYGAARFVAACEREGVRPILGASLTVRERGRDAPLVLLAQDERGYANLCRLITDAHMLGERGDPAITATQICAHAAGLVAIAGPRSHAGRLAVRGRHGCGRRGAPSVPRSVRPRTSLRRGRTSDGARLERRDPLDAPPRRPRGAPRRRHEPGPLPRARGRVPRRRARVHARDRADRRQPRLPQERRGMAEAGRGDAPAVRRAARPLRRDARDRRDVPVRPRPEAGPFPGLPDAGRDAAPTRSSPSAAGPASRPGDDRGRAPARPDPPRALDDPADGLRGVLPHGRRHHGRHPRDGDPRRVPRERRRLARVLPAPDLRRRRAPARPRVRTLPEPDARRAPGHRRRRRVGPARGRLRHGAVSPRRRADRLRRDDRHVPGALGGPRGGQGARPAGGRGRDGGEVVPAHLGAEPPGGDGEAARSSTGSTSRWPSSSCCSAWPSDSTASRVTSRCIRAGSCCPPTTSSTGCRWSAPRTATG